MKVVHRISEGSSVISKNGGCECRGFCLGDINGGYLWLDVAPTSRYQGWFINLKGNLVKILENIEVAGASPVQATINNLWNAKRVRGAVTEEFFLPGKHNSLVYRVSRPSDIVITLDIKESYKNDEPGRHYGATRSGNCIIIDFHQDNASLGEFFLAVASDSSKSEICHDWIKREYSYDRGRGSAPFGRWVYRSLAIKGASKVTIAAAKNRDDAIREASLVYNGLVGLKSKRRQDFMDTVSLFRRNFGIDHARGLHADSELAAAGICAASALRSLLVRQNDVYGLFAGFPWFFQFWQRDEAISLGGLALADPAAALGVFWHLISDLENGFDGKSPDGIGWTFFAAREFIMDHLISLKDRSRVALILEKTISYLLKNQTVGGYAVVDGQMTWMDSIKRFEAPIELQALRLNIYHLASMICASSSKREFYHSMEIDLLLKARKNFVVRDNLADGYDPLTKEVDLSVRPNIFLAAHAYPGLLENSRWEKYIDGVLPKLWLDWGGLASVGIDDGRFHPIHSGEHPASYHNGDSWFYLNNIAGLVLCRLNHIKYHSYVKKIFSAGIRNVLWGQVPGYSSELSSAREFKPQGCFNQAWSNATFLELFQAIGSRHREVVDFGS